MTEQSIMMCATSPRDTMVCWLTQQAFPLWAETGWDATLGMFLERLDMAARPLPDVPRRAMVQARQIFAYGIAARRGWSAQAADRIDRAGDSLVKRYYRADGAPGWVFAVDRSGAVSDTRRDLYGHAFVLLALATLATVSGNRRMLVLADETLDFLETSMASPAGGYVDALPAPTGGALRQNPHMHLFEALLALHEAAPDGPYLDRAGRLLDLMTSRFLQGPDRVLAEFFDADWSPLGGPDVAFEPGHHFEWVWLITRYAALRGQPAPDFAPNLWATATRLGLGPESVIYDEVSPERGVLQRSTRLWPYTEAAKAACCPATRSMPLDPEGFLSGLHRRFLQSAPAGSWIDHLDADLVPQSSFAPASSL